MSFYDKNCCIYRLTNVLLYRDFTVMGTIFWNLTSNNSFCKFIHVFLPYVPYPFHPSALPSFIFQVSVMAKAISTCTSHLTPPTTEMDAVNYDKWNV